MAKHFGRELEELTLEALIKLEGGELEEENQEENVPKRKGPSLASILGRMSSSSSLGLSETFSHSVGDDVENGKFVSRNSAGNFYVVFFISWDFFSFHFLLFL